MAASEAVSGTGPLKACRYHTRRIQIAVWLCDCGGQGTHREANLRTRPRSRYHHHDEVTDYRHVGDRVHAGRSEPDWMDKASSSTLLRWTEGLVSAEKGSHPSVCGEPRGSVLGAIK
jgi:hypothetical protein